MNVPPELFGVGIALMVDRGELAHPGTGLAQGQAIFLGFTSRSPARCISLASVGKVTAFSSTVVSTITWRKSAARPLLPLWPPQGSPAFLHALASARRTPYARSAPHLGGMR